MDSDFENLKQNDYAIRKVNLPDGSEYIQLRVLSIKQVNLHEIESLVRRLISENQDLEIRLIFSNKEIALGFISFAYDFESKSINHAKAHRIRDTLDKYQEDSDTSTFVVRRKDGMILGAFTMIETDDEVQFHSAAGRPLNELKDLPRKLWVIDYFAIRLAQYLQKPMRFSSSGAIHLYQEMGISQDNRFGVVLRKKKI